MEDFPDIAALLDMRIVEDLACALDTDTRDELLASFEADALSLLNALDTGSETEKSAALHALLGVTGLIGARQLHDELGLRHIQVHRLRATLTKTVALLRVVMTSVAAQKGQ